MGILEDMWARARQGNGTRNSVKGKVVGNLGQGKGRVLQVTRVGYGQSGKGRERNGWFR